MDNFEFHLMGTGVTKSRHHDPSIIAPNSSHTGGFNALLGKPHM